MESQLMIGPEEMNRIDQAQHKLSRLEFPKVRVVNPDLRIEDPDTKISIDVYGQRVDWFRLNQFKQVTGDYLLSPHTELELFERGLHIAAAKMQLVTIKKVMPAGSLILEATQAIIHVRDFMPTVDKVSCLRTFDPKSWWPDPRECVDEYTAWMFEFLPNEGSQRGVVHFYKFIAKHELTIEEWPYAADFLSKAEAGIFKEHKVPPTQAVRLIANLLKDINNFDGSNFDES